MAVNGVTNSNSNFIRFGGLATGLDTDSIIKQLMDAERIPLNRLNQNKTLLEWKRDNYRDITNTLRTFRDDFMDVLKPASNMRSDAAYKKFTVSSTNTSVVTASATTSAIEGTHTISQVTSLATAANTTSTATVTKDLAGTAAAALDYTGANQFQVTLDGVTKTITLRNGVYASAADLVSNGSNDGIQDLVNTAFGAGKITVTQAAGVIKFTAVSSKITLANGTTNNALGNLQFASGASNRINTSDTLATLATKLSGVLTFDGSNNLVFNINNQTTPFTISNTKTLNDLMNQINSSAAGVTISYSELTDKFTLTAKQKGAGDNIIINNTGGTFFGAAGAINIAAVGSVSSVSNGSVNAGTDAQFTLDGVVTTRNDNTFTIDGITYTLNSLYAGPPNITLTTTKDVDGVYKNIKDFVDRYNEVIGKINTELSEKYDRNYLPLTEEQKKDMSKEDIKAWEDKAKTGLLRSDPILSKIVDSMRKSLSDTITGVSGTLSSIGINTSSNYLDKGKLIIDETKLKDAIRTTPDLVKNLFNQTSTTQPSYSPDLTSAQRTTRYNEEGIVNRIYDIVQDNIRTTRNTSGKKGTLLEKAGLVGDVTEIFNLMTDDINKKNDDIAELERKLSKKEARYYKIFTALEKSVSQMNSQSSWLSQQFSGGN